MDVSNQYTVAKEFGYSESTIKNVLQNYTFKDSASLVDYLCENFEIVESEESEEKMLTVSIRKEPQISVTDLRFETGKLYRHSRCKNHSCTNPLSRLCLPCSHLSLCEQSITKIKRCPCGDPIDFSIRTYTA